MLIISDRTAACRRVRISTRTLASRGIPDSTKSQPRLSPAVWVERCLACPDREAQHTFLHTYAGQADEAVAHLLKQRADQQMRSAVGDALQIAQLLLELGEKANLPVARALGLTAEANALTAGGLGDYDRAVACYEQAAAIYQSLQRPLEQATVVVGKVSALAFLGRYADALVAGQWAAEILATYAQWQTLAGLQWNLAIVYGRQGDDMGALEKFDQVLAFYQQLGEAGVWSVPMVEQNRAIVLRNLGQFPASIQASLRAAQLFAQLGQTAELARARQNLAITYVVLGRYNEALELLDSASQAFRQDSRHADALLVELYVAECLLHLRRFQDVLEKCQSICRYFAHRGTQLELGQARLYEGVALAGLGRYAEALLALQVAADHFRDAGNGVWGATAALERAAVLLQQGAYAESLQASQACCAIFQQHELPVRHAQSCLLAARAALALHQAATVQQLLAQVFALSAQSDIPTLAYQAHYLLGELCKQQGEVTRAHAAYARAIQELERLRGNLMVEFRADFLADKQNVYEEMVDLCLAQQEPTLGFTYAERAKSRALLDLLAQRVDLRIQAKDAHDQQDVAQLLQLRQERDRLYRRWEGQSELRQRGAVVGIQAQAEQQQILALEKQITAIWHKLLVHNADYARQATLWQLHTEPVQIYLPADTLLIEYFTIHGTLVAFLVSRTTVTAVRLPTPMSRVIQLTQLLQLNIRSVIRSTPTQLQSLTQNAIGLLQQLYNALVAPYAEHLADYRHLQIVPHGPLHYLPFHALHDGERYLVETHEISYLPGADLLRYGREPQMPSAAATTPAAGSATQTLVLGHSLGDRLPHTLIEAQQVAALTGGHALLNGQATTANLQRAAATCQILHFATHGDFRHDNPLFSGLALEDSWLTTLDIFHLRLNASLVTLSACQTGRHVIGGGDELLGIMRAFLYAGAASLVATLWSVEDHSTATLMRLFYTQLMNGTTKGAALRQAQLSCLADQRQAHPFFWAPFFLVGDAGPL
ncbi:MAG: CHAT domain-containing protein [Caldilineaceae bacterium]|nr:CHAT domain-containing protein [Caldilineaceae bacterium]